MVVLGARKPGLVYEMDPVSSELKGQSLPSSDEIADLVAFFQSASRLYYAEALHPDVPAGQ